MRKIRIGVIDSGKGGVYLAEKLRQQFPECEFFCESDEVNVPYGEKTPTELIQLGTELLKRVLQHDPQMIILACHTLSSWCFRELQAASPVPVWSVNTALLEEISLLPAKSTLTLWGTSKTIESKWFQNAISERRADLQVRFQPCPGLASFIERNEKEEIDRYLQELLENESADSIALACTHYPVITNEIREKYSGNILDPHKNIAAKLENSIQSFSLSQSTL